jgi:hypothetical protein
LFNRVHFQWPGIQAPELSYLPSTHVLAVQVAAVVVVGFSTTVSFVWT